MPAAVAADDQHHLLCRVLDLPALAGLDEADLRAVLDEAAGFAEGVVAPASREGDRVGARYGNGVVAAPPGYAAVHAAWRAGGWQGLAGPERAHGAALPGQCLPGALWAASLELFSAADMAWTLNPLLTAGAVELLLHHASPEQAARWLPPLASAEWNGTMCLTESAAGSDLSAVRTRAEPDGAGGYRLTGEKIYITWGEHDLGGNTLHLVLARRPGAPEGSRGISLFACPKLLPDGARNGVRCAGIERKLGIHGSPTCTMVFEEARAELVGEPERGLAAMFSMMNAARLAVGVEGVGQCQRATDLAQAYAAQRQQNGRPIAAHPDVARMLGEMRATTRAARGIALDCAVSLDRARITGDADAAARAAALTPICKAWCTARGVAVADLGVQVHGGMGFVEESGAAQVLRDARIAPIYEGTNGIQAMDLAGRKLGRDGGAAVLALIAEAGAADPRLLATAEAVAGAARHLLDADADAEALGAGAAPFLEAMGWLLGGASLARSAAADPDPASGRAADAAFFLARLLPRARACCAEATAGGVAPLAAS